MAPAGPGPGDEPAAIAALVRDLGEQRRDPTGEELRRLRTYLATAALARPNNAKVDDNVHPREGSLADGLPARAWPAGDRTGCVCDRWAMAPKINLRARIDISLEVVRRSLASVSRLEERWASIDSPDDAWADQVCFRTEWLGVVSRLDQLGAWRAAGKMTEAQVEHYSGLLPVVVELLPIMKRLHLQLPSARVLEQAAAARAAGAHPVRATAG